jgi:hypothetical protein
MLDRNFAKTAADAGNAEVTMGHLAKNRGHSADVRTFATRMVVDHQQAGRGQGLAARKGIALPAQLSTKNRSELDKLSRLQGDVRRRSRQGSTRGAEAVSSSLRKLRRQRRGSQAVASSVRPTLEDTFMVQQLADGGKNAS